MPPSAGCSAERDAERLVPYDIAHRHLAKADACARMLGMSLKPCYLSQILIDDQDNQYVVFVTEHQGNRRIPIVIGPMEAVAIDRAVKGQRFSRPLTHDLIIAMLDAAHLRCKEVRIIDLKEGTFYAELLLASEQELDITLDCRPSDALALMVRLPSTPLMVAEEVLAEAGN